MANNPLPNNYDGEIAVWVRELFTPEIHGIHKTKLSKEDGDEIWKAIRNLEQSKGSMDDLKNIFSRLNNLTTKVEACMSQELAEQYQVMLALHYALDARVEALENQ